MNSEKANVIIYSRPGCHLCDDAKLAMAAAGITDQYTLIEINIANDADLLRRYQYDIPVITIDGHEAFRHHVNTEQFKQLLTGRS